VFQSPLTTDDRIYGDHLVLHGDAVKDVAFAVDDVVSIYENAIKKGAKSIRSPWEEQDEHGKVVMATIATYGDVEHTLIQRAGYKGEFLPGYLKSLQDPITLMLPKTQLLFVDHIVGNQPDLEMEAACKM
jgi:4-hydroxyphenylpyruvate dioxygenase